MKFFITQLGLGFAGLAFAFGHASLADGETEGGLSEEQKVRIPHQSREIEGWTVMVDESLLAGEYEKQGELALRVLKQRLNRIVMRLPEEPRKEMQKVIIFLDRAHPLGNAHFHPSQDWLVSHGYDPAMTEAVHITHANSLVNGSSRPMGGSVVLHELAHAYHYRVLGFEHAEILEGYAAFCSSGKFDTVTYPGGRQRPHYGLMDHKEFFAELTETFFVENNSYPFNRTELALYHPESYLLMAKIWGVKVPAPKGKWSKEPTAWDLRMLATVASQRGEHEKAIKLVARAKELEPKNERLDALLEKIEEEKAALEVREVTQ